MGAPSSRSSCCSPVARSPIRDCRAVGFAERIDASAEFSSARVGFLEPFDAANRLAIGYDVMSEPRLRAAMERARDTGSAALSAKIVLAEDLRRGVRTASFLLVLPVYSSATLPETVAQRRATLRGFVYSLSGPKISSARRSPTPATVRSSKCSTATRRTALRCSIERTTASRRTP
jgi:hypothetical protein